MNKESPVRLGLIGLGLLVTIYSIIHHLLSSPAPMAMLGASPRSGMAFAAGLGLMAIPSFSQYVTQVLAFIGKLLGIVKQIEVAVPTKLVTDIIAMIGTGHVDLGTLFTDFQNVDPKVIMDLVHQLVALFGGTMQVVPSPLPGPPDPPAPKMTMTADPSKVITVS